MPSNAHRYRKTIAAGLFSLCLTASCAGGERGAGLPRASGQDIANAVTASTHAGNARLGRSGELTPAEMQMARVAWKYFENNYQESTGLVNAVQDYPSVTMWDIGSYIGGMVAARELGIIEASVFDQRMMKMLGSLNVLDFFRGELPNKVYHTKTNAKVDYKNQPGEIGYSALDLGRLLIWLQIIKDRYPAHSNAIDRFVLRWNFCRVLDDEGTMYGTAVGPDGKTQYLQEGRLGYEEYSAKGFQLWGFSTARASRPEPYEMVPVEGVEVAVDKRDPRFLGAHNYVVSESYVLDGVEFNWDKTDDKRSPDDVHTDADTADFAQRVYLAQERRWRATGIVTARTEHQLDGPPYFVYDTVFTDGYPWNTITDSGKHVPAFAAVATKGALGLWAIWNTPYTDLLWQTIANLYDPAKGYYEGVYENGKGPIKAFTANNNGIILETLLHKKEGKLLKAKKRASLWDTVMADEFARDQENGKKKCFWPEPRGK
jgi:hypothetical protein